VQSIVKGKRKKTKGFGLFHCGLHIILKDEIERIKLKRKKKKNLNEPD